MIYAVLRRTLKDGVSFEEFREAWRPPPGGDAVDFVVTHARSVADPREILSVGRLDVHRGRPRNEVRQLGRTIVRWSTQIAAWHQARGSNGPTEAVNNLLKRVKRVAFGFRRFGHYRIRALLYAASPTGTYSPRSPPAEREAPV
ncbi:MAG: transposase [Microthrixaceae bacterium]